MESSLRRSAEISETAQVFDCLLIQRGLGTPAKHGPNLLLRSDPLPDLSHQALEFTWTLRGDIVPFGAVRGAVE